MFPKTILLVEDEALIAINEKRQLEKEGYQVLHVMNGEDAVETVSTNNPPINLILMDINLGSGMDGTQTAQQILQKHDIPVVFLSSHTEKEVVEKTEKITSYGYVVKHSGITVLDASIKMAFKLHKADKELRHTNEKLRLAQEASHAGTWDWDIVQNTFDWSPEFLKIFGMASDTVAGFEAWTDALHPEDREMAGLYIQESIANKTDLMSDYRIILPGGEIRWIRATGKTYYDREQPVRMTGLCMDITQLKQAEQIFRDNESALRKTIDALPALVWSSLPDGSEDFVNQQWLSYTGLTMEQAQGSGWMQALHPDDRAPATQTWQESSRTGGNYEVEQRLRRWDGEYRWFLTRAQPVKDAEGNVLKWYGVNTDITERKQAEKEVELFFDLVPDLICIASTDGYFKKLNKEWERVLGYTQDELLSVPIVDFVHPDDRGATVREVARQAAGEATLHFTNRYRTKNNTYRWFEWNSTPSPDGISLYAVAHDFTEQKQSEENLRKSEQEKSILVEKLKEAQRVAKIGSWEWDMQLNTLWWSDETYRIFGVSPEEYLPSVEENILFCYPDDREAYEKAFSRAIAEITPLACGARLVSRNGQLKECFVQGQVILDGCGKPARFVGTIMDVTERKQTEKALAHSDRLMRYIIEHNLSGVAVHDRDLKYIYVSQRYLDEYNLKEQNVIGRYHYEIFPDLPQKWRDVHQRVLAGEILSADNDLYERADGSLEWTRWECRPWYELDGSVGGIIVFTEVVTDRVQIANTLRKSQNRLVEAQRIAGLGDWEWDARADRITWSKGLYDLMLLDDSVPVPSLSEASRFLTEESMERIREAVEVILRTGKPCELDLEMIRTDGGRLWVSARGEVTYNEQHEMVGLRGTVFDMTERKKVDDQIRALLSEKELLLREVHHRVKNNMSTIMSLLVLQADMQEDVSAQTVLQDAAGRVKSMMVLYDRLYQSQEFNGVSIQQYIPTLVREIAGLFPFSGKVKIETEIEDIVLAPNILSTVGIILNELTTNAMKYAFVGREDGVITITARRVGERIRIAFADNGVGLPEAVTVDQSPGFGMQLLGILVQQIRGSIMIERRNGTCFVIEFC